MRDDCTGIEGIEGWEAEMLIAALADHIVKPAFAYRHQWRVGDLLMWTTAPCSTGRSTMTCRNAG
jgi:alpha-ketoglutarate-dependent taurine dioxygenase